jgi:hypothetical protein
MESESRLYCRRRYHYEEEPEGWRYGSETRNALSGPEEEVLRAESDSGSDSGSGLGIDSESAKD